MKGSKKFLFFPRWPHSGLWGITGLWSRATQRNGICRFLPRFWSVKTPMAYTHCKILQYDLQLRSVAVVQRRTGPVSLITRFLPMKCWRTGACEHTAHHSDHVLEEKKSALGYFCHITPKVTSRPQNNKWDDFSEWWYKIKGLCARKISHFPELICFIRKRLPGNWLFKNSVNGISVHLYLCGFPKLKLPSQEGSSLVIPSSPREGIYYLNRYRPMTTDSQYLDHSWLSETT